MPRIAKIERKKASLASQAALCYNGGIRTFAPAVLVTPRSRIHLIGDVPMTTVPPRADNGNIPTTSGIYKITCTANKRIYIGSSTNLCRRKNEHWNDLRQNKHSNPIMQSAWNKYGEGAFTFEVLELVLPMDPTNREQHWLNKFNPFGRKGFNIARDARAPMRGTNGRKASPEARDNMRQAQRNRKVSPENLEKMRRGSLGKKQSPEHIKNRTQQAIGRKHSPEWVENNRRSHLGHKPTPETREKQRQAHLGHTRNLGYKHTTEARENMRQAQIGRKHSLETIEKMRQAKLGKQGDAKGRWLP